MTWIIPFLVFCAGTEIPLDSRFPEGTEIFRCTFDTSWDANYDGWPDQWTRRQGPGYPHYVNIRISEEPSPVGNRCLRMEMDGGGATTYSPPIQVGPLFSYVMEGYVRTDGLVHNRAFVSLTFLDEQRRRLQTVQTRSFRKTDGWCKVRIGPIAPEREETRFAVLGLHVEPGEREDLRGSVSFDDIWLARLPRMALSANGPHNLFFDTRDVEILSKASGFSQSNATVTLRLTDALGSDLQCEQRHLDVRAADTHVAVSIETFAEGSSGLVGETRWRPEIPGPGFYRVEAAMEGESSLIYRRQINLAVIDSQELVPGTEFGWTLPDEGKSLPLGLLGQLVKQAGVGRVKYPLWFGDDRSEQDLERMVGFVERLSTAGIELVGVLDKPPQALRSKYGGSNQQDAAQVFAPEPEVWYPSLEPVMTRLATRVRSWQLGDDLDTSFTDSLNPAGKLREVKAELDRIGQNVNLGLGWNWMHAFPRAATEPAPWRFMTLSAAPVLSAEELGTYLRASEGAGLARWVALQPLPADEYPTEIRATDLVDRMIAAKIHGAEAVFCPEPFSDTHGLMNRDGTPGELFFPWRVTALALGKATYLGSIDLPNGSPNHIFARQDDAVMVVWNWHPTEETAYLGTATRQVDLWGHETTPPADAHCQIIEVRRVPTFITGLDPAIARWHLNCQFAHDRMASVFAVSQHNSFRFRNTFDHGIVGEAAVVVPDCWIVEPRRFTFRLAEGEPIQQPFSITLPFNATTGRHPVRIDFDLQGVPRQKFSVHRHIDVGLGIVSVDIQTRVNEQGELEVVQRLINDGTSPVSFRCQLFLPGKPRMMSQVVGLVRGYHEEVYRIPEGAGLLGETLWLRAEEMDGPRVLNYRFVAAK